MKNNLPPNWEWKRLDEVGNYINGKAFKPSDWKTHGRPIIRIQNLTGSTHVTNYFDGEVEDKYLIQNGDLLVSWSASLGIFIWEGDEAVLNQHIFKVIPKIDKKFLYYCLQYILPKLIQKIHGSGMKHITKGKFDETLVPIPPEPIQKKIVQKLDYIFDELKEKETKISQIYKNSDIKHIPTQSFNTVLFQAFSGQLSKNWRNENKQFETGNILLNKIKLVREKLVLEKVKDKSKKNIGKNNFEVILLNKSNEFPKIPESWCWSTLNSICDPMRGITYGVIKLGPDDNDGVPCLRTSDVKPLEIKLDKVKKISKKIANKYKRTFLNGGEILVNVRGTLGGIAIVPETIRGYNISREIAMVPILPEVSPEFFAFWISSPFAQNWLNGITRGIAYVGINLEHLRMLPIPLPSVTEQKKIVEIIKDKREILTSIKLKLDIITNSRKEIDKSIKNLPESILNYAFSGKLS